MIRTWTLPICLLAVLGIVGCGGTSVTEKKNAPQNDLDSVTIVPIDRSGGSRTTTQPAVVHPWYEARIHAKVTGYVSDIQADIGKEVDADETLAVIAVPELQKRKLAKEAQVRRTIAQQEQAKQQSLVAESSTKSAEANLARAEADVEKSEAMVRAMDVELKRTVDLVGSKSVADRMLDESRARAESAQAENTSCKAAVTSAEAEVALAKAEAKAAQAQETVAQAMTDVANRELDELTELTNYTELKAPFDGIVTHRNVELGDLLRESTGGSGAEPAYVITQLNKVRVRVPLPERDAPLADVGDPATVTFPAVPGKPFEGSISRISRTLDDRTRTMAIEIDVENPDSKLIPGMFGEATITLTAKDERLTLPAKAVHYDGQGKASVYIVDASDTIAIVPVTTGNDDGERIEIVSGLTGTERVVGPSLKRFTPGQKVTIRW